MKKFILIILACFLSIPVMNSQTKPFFSVERPDKILEIDVHALVGTSVLSQDYASHVPSITSVEASPGCGFGAGVSAQMVFKDFFALGTRLDLLVNNNKYSMALLDVDGAGAQSSVFVANRSVSANVPVFVSVRCNISDNVRWNVDGGCYFSLGLGGYQKADTYTTMLNDLGQMVSEYQKYKWDYYNEKQPLIHGIDDVDIGLYFGTGLLINDHYNVGIETRISTKNASTDGGVIHPNMYNHLFAMKLGYQF